ncbi:NAD(P)-binding protein [Mycobacterium tilburgii]|uniref:NAD(P)-binding protein n=1 Tax=Mycobacterium tilburgii TaxID=44467 RepID=UPI0021B19596
MIGAGFGGLGAAYELFRDSLAEVTVLEKADDVGGVWAGQHLFRCRLRCPVQPVLVLLRPQDRPGTPVRRARPTSSAIHPRHRRPARAAENGTDRSGGHVGLLRREHHHLASHDVDRCCARGRRSGARRGPAVAAFARTAS